MRRRSSGRVRSSRCWCAGRFSASLHVEGLGTRGLSRRVECDLLDPRLRLAQQLLTAALQDLPALIDRDGLLKRNITALELLHDLLELGERFLEGELRDVGVGGLDHGRLTSATRPGESICA